MPLKVKLRKLWEKSHVINFTANEKGLSKI